MAGTARPLDGTDSDGNTPLHLAILTNNKDEVARLVSNDMKAYDAKSSVINRPALGNTPLLLALKKGNVPIIKELLKHPNIDVTLPDSRGLTALHFACMLRMDEVILLLLDRGANPHYQTLPWFPTSPQRHNLSEHPESLLCDTRPITPISLYEKNISFSSTWDNMYNATPPDGMNEYDFFIDRSSLCVRGPGLAAYTDIMIFHLANVVINLGWKKSAYPLFLGLDGETGTGLVVDKRRSQRSCNVFRENYHIGIDDFMSSRNAVPVDATVLNKMKETRPLEMKPVPAIPSIAGGFSLRHTGSSDEKKCSFSAKAVFGIFAIGATNYLSCSAYAASVSSTVPAGTSALICGMSTSAFVTASAFIVPAAVSLLYCFYLLAKKTSCFGFFSQTPDNNLQHRDEASSATASDRLVH